MKTYNPPERTCPICGKMFITRTPTEYAYKRLDHRRGSGTYKQTLFFCSFNCKSKYDKLYPPKGKYGGH